MAELEGHNRAVLSCEWSPDGRRLASVGRRMLTASHLGVALSSLPRVDGCITTRVSKQTGA